ncbi:MAG TPA: DUF4347 domain-containing protein [Plasticicumulans sp.]|nr:DUF4347 domain-containing protein [Plasticicumulans sp.]
MTRNPRRPAGSRSPASLMLALEPRLMFDAAALSSAADTLTHADPAGEAAVAAVEAARASDSPAAAGTASDSAAAAGTATVATAAPAPTADTGTTAPALLAAIASDSPQTTAADATVASAPAGQRHELAIIDTSLTGWQTLAAGLRDGIEVLTIDGSRDGFAQLADALAGRERGGLDAIHVFSHGSEGQWRLGSSALDVNTEAAHASELQAIAAALAADGDLLLYGCDTGAGSRGTAFLDRLASATGADVAASTDRSGSATAGGNWTLEAQRGAIETATAADAAKLADYNGTLATYTVTSTADSGAGSFRQAVLDANASGGTDTIVFDNSLDNQTITLTGGVISVTDSLIIDGDLDGDDTPDVILSGGGASRGLDYTSSSTTGIALTVRSLEFANFSSTTANAGGAIHFFLNTTPNAIKLAKNLSLISRLH